MSASWTHSGYVLLSGKARIEGLRQHIAEVSDALFLFKSRNIADMGYSRHDLSLYLRELKTELESLSPSRRPQAAFVRLK
jgi:hypothetical protein